jgi:transposase
MLSMLKRHEVQRLRAAGLTQRATAKAAGVSVPSVKRIDREAAVASADDATMRRARRIGRPSKAEPFRKLISDVLAQEPQLLGVELLRRARAAGYAGGKSALYELVRELRPAPVKALMRFEGLAGEFSQHDFGEVDVTFVDERVQRVHFFASRLKYSRWVEVSVTPDQTTESLVRAWVEHNERWGGVPLLAVFDRPKTIAIKWADDGRVTQWNSTFAEVSLELGVGVSLCWPYSPQQKGAVENLVGWVKGSFFKQRRFVDHEDLCRQLGEWLREVNTVRPSRATNVVPAVRRAEEQPRLRPVPVASEALALRYPVVVGPTAMVSFGGAQYSMPPEAIGLSGTLHLHREKVRIVAGKHLAEHARLREKNARSVLPQHRAAHVAAVSGKRGKRYLQREHLLALGPVALEYLTELLHRAPWKAMHEVEQLHDLLQAHGEGATRTAIGLALARDQYGAAYVKNHLQLPLISEAS